MEQRTLPGGLRQATNTEKLRTYRFFLGHIWRANPRLAAFRFFLLVAGAFLQPIEIFTFSLLITAITTGGTTDAIWLIAIVIAAYGLRRIISDVTYSKVDDWFARNTTFATQLALMEHVSRLAPDALSRRDVRKDLDFSREELWRLNRLPDKTEWLLRSFFKLLASSGLAFIAPWWVAALVIVDAIVQAFNSWVESNSDLWTAAWNSIGGRRFEYARYVFMRGEEFQEMKLLGAADAFLGKVKRACAEIIAKFKAAAFASLRNRLAIAVLHVAAYSVVIFVLGLQAFSGPSALAVLYVALNLFGLMGDALSGISGSVSQLSTDLGILTHVHRLFQLAPEQTTGRHVPKQPLIIVFKDVSFRYPGTTRDALHQVSVTIRESEHLAIVGENGAGKTTFLRLLSGLNHPTEGEILLNGIPLEQYRKSDWRRAFHLMLQEASLYEDFVRDNLLYGVPPKAWRHAAFTLEQGVGIAGADAVISDLPDGYNTFLGTWVAPPHITPHTVSGGQRQKLLIARTLIHGGRIIGFDEPTSALDALAESLFFERLHDAMRERGLIYISHRFSTVRRAPRIIVFHEGRLIEDGSHDDLVSRGGKYAELYTEQAKWYESPSRG